MEFRDNKNVLIETFRMEFVYDSSTMIWKEFINNKDLGIRYIQDLVINKRWTKCYDVVDEKKWLLAKIKYGI